MLLLNLCCSLHSSQAPGACCFHGAKDKLEQAPDRGFLYREDSSQQMKWTCPDGMNFHEHLLQGLQRKVSGQIGAITQSLMWRPILAPAGWEGVENAVVSWGSVFSS